MPQYDAVIVGAGPNGLAAAVHLARAGRSVLVVEAKDQIGGGSRTAELTLPDFRHDVCATSHPFGLTSPFFSSLDLHRHGLDWVHPEIPLAHPLDDGAVALLHRSLDDTVEGLGSDGPRYRRLMEPTVKNFDMLRGTITGPVLSLPRHPLVAARFGLTAVRSARGLARRFKSAPAAALVAGAAAHAIAPLTHRFTGGMAVALMGAGHAVGWPFARGGSQAIVEALFAELTSRGGVVKTGTRIEDLGQLPPATVTLLDVAPGALDSMTGGQLGKGYREGIARFTHAPAAFKVDWALDGPIPWTAADVAKAGVVHVGGTFEEIAAAEAEVSHGGHPERPFAIVAQPTLFDSSRAPAGKHVAWGYCHVPNGSATDMTDRLESQIERFAPGFKDRIIAKSVMSPNELEAYNENYVGGDIAGGAMTWRQIVARPMLRRNPYSTPMPGIYLCSASTPPGAGVHGMCGFHAAESALRYLAKEA